MSAEELVPASAETKETDKAVAPPSGSIFTNPANYIKHPLKSTWVLWFDNPSLQGRKAQKNWEEALELIYVINTVEDFWGVYNNIVPAQAAPTGSNYHLFKEGIKPMWEDPQNKRGGKWVHVIEKKHRQGPVQNIDKMWLETMLLCVGEQFEENDNKQVCGAVFSCRQKADKVALWTRDAQDEAGCRRIGTKLKQILDVDVPLGYQGHADAMRRGSSFTNAHRHTV